MLVFVLWFCLISWEGMLSPTYLSLWPELCNVATLTCQGAWEFFLFFLFKAGKISALNKIEVLLVKNKRRMNIGLLSVLVTQMKKLGLRDAKDLSCPRSERWPWQIQAHVCLTRVRVLDHYEWWPPYHDALQLSFYLLIPSSLDCELLTHFGILDSCP